MNRCYCMEPCCRLCYPRIPQWERDLLAAAEEEQRNRDRDALIKKYDKALKALDENPVAIVESTYRGLLGEFAREWERI